MSAGPDSMREQALAIVRKLRAAGFEAFWVGGCVRDLLLNRAPGDFDIVTNALPDEVEKLFPRTIPVGKKFGVIVVVTPEGQFQVATYRAESGYRDGRRPEEVTFGDAKADVTRRDFTINGLLMDPLSGEITDWTGGQADLAARLIRTIGEPDERFAEDHLRMLRAVRFAAELQFALDEKTLAAIQRTAPRIQAISPERIREELVRIFRPPHAGRGLRLLQESGLLKHVLPELEATVACEQSPDFHPEGSVFNHLVLMLEQLPPESEAMLPWAVLMHDVAKPVTASRDARTGSIHFYEHERIGAEMARQIMERLRFANRDVDAVVEAVRHHMQFKDAPHMRLATLRRLLMRPTFPLELQLHRLDCLGSHRRLDVYDFLTQKADELKNQPQVIPPLLTGHDLLAMGMKEGPDLGRLMAQAREKQLQDELTTREQALQWAREQLG